MAVIRTTNSVRGILATQGKRYDVLELVDGEWKTLKRAVGVGEAADMVLALAVAGRHGMLSASS